MTKFTTSGIALVWGLCTLGVSAQTTQLHTRANGTIDHIVFADPGCDTLRFHDQRFDGPALLLGGERLPLTLSANQTLSGNKEGLAYSIHTSVQNDKVLFEVRCTNHTDRDLDHQRLTLNLGINNTMSHYPQWRSAYFPTLLRVEPTHLWGYLMSPNGGIITVSSPDEWATYELYYNNAKSKFSFSHGHLIPSFGLDLINPNRLPERIDAPRKKVLKKGESRTWRLYLGGTTDLQSVVKLAATQCAAPVVTAEHYTIEPEQAMRLKVYAAQRPVLQITSPEGQTESLALKPAGKGVYTAQYTRTAAHGLYAIKAVGGGKVATASVNVRYPWSHYALSARRAAHKYPQKAGSHTESWYGLFSAYIAAELFPDAEQDRLTDEKFDELYPLIHDTTTHLPTTYKTRIQNSALMAALLAQKYRAQGQEDDLRRAANILDFLMTQQSSDGAYRSVRVHYTSVIYIAKAFMEVMAQEKKLAAHSPEWASNYKRHYHSVKQAIDELAKNLDNIETEGEMTYEDGMISCSYSQIALFALLQPEGSAERARYVAAAEQLVRGHRALSQLVVPDARMNGGSLRYWEAQYDILSFPNMMNSPHGWSAWRIYGLQYLYRLTGKEHYLLDMINAMGACTQLLNPTTDQLNWAFVADPYIEAEVFVPDPQNPGQGRYESRVIGEQYMPMISDWYRAPKSTWASGYWQKDGGCCDNDVHEIFKCMGEVALPCAYAHRRADGSLLLWNCSATEQGGTLVVEPNQDCVTTLYTNTKVSGSIPIVVAVP